MEVLKGEELYEERQEEHGEEVGAVDERGARPKINEVENVVDEDGKENRQGRHRHVRETFLADHVDDEGGGGSGLDSRSESEEQWGEEKNARDCDGEQLKQWDHELFIPRDFSMG